MRLEVLTVPIGQLGLKSIELDGKKFYAITYGNKVHIFNDQQKLKAIGPHINIMIVRKDFIAIGTKILENNGFRMSVVHANRLSPASMLNSKPYVVVEHRNHIIYADEIGSKLIQEFELNLDDYKMMLDNIMSIVDELMKLNISLKTIERNATKLFSLYEKKKNAPKPAKKQESRNAKATVNIEVDQDLTLNNTDTDSEDAEIFF